MTSRYWSTAEDGGLRSLLAQGLTYAEIAKRMPGRSQFAIANRVKAQGLKGLRLRPRRRNPYDDELLRQLWCVERLSASEIAKRMPGRTRNAIIGRAGRLGLIGGSRAGRSSKPKSMLRFGKLSIRKSVRPVEPLAPERLAGNPVTLIERAPHQCGWPVNDGGPFLFCGAAKYGHKRYCAAHARASVKMGRTA